MTDRGLEEDDVENGQKLDNIQETITELRVSVATLSGDVRAALGRLDGHDAVMADVERRIRTLEHRSYAIPGIGAVLGIAGFALALWGAIRR